MGRAKHDDVELKTEQKGYLDQVLPETDAPINMKDPNAVDSPVLTPSEAESEASDNGVLESDRQ